MRVTQGMLCGRVIDNLMGSSERLIEAQNRASSGKRITAPSDDITGASKAIRLRSVIANLKQFQRNAGLVQSQLTITSSALDSIVSSLRTVRNIAVSSGNAALTEAGKAAAVSQLEQIANEIAASANTQHLGKYILGGSQTTKQPIIPNAGGTPPYIYQGDQAQITIQVAPSTYVTTNVTAYTVLNMESSVLPGVNDVFSTIDALRNQIEAGDVQAISGLISDIDALLSNVTAIRSQVGARLSRLETITTTLGDSETTFKDLLSKTEDADLAQAVIELRTRENAYQAAIATASRLLEISLAEYLR